MNTKSIGSRIKSARIAANITQTTLAYKVGCTTQHISAIERGVKLPRLDTFVNIANALSASTEIMLQDVIKHPMNSVSGEFSFIVGNLPIKEQHRILNAVKIFTENYDRD